MVGHYWLRAPDLAPSPEIAAEIRKTVADVKTFAADVHGGDQAADGPTGSPRVLSHRHRRVGPRPDVRGRRPGRPGRRQDEDRLHRQHRPGRHRPRPRTAGRQAPRDAVRGHVQERRHAGDPQRHAARRRGLPGRRARASRGTRSRSRCPARRWTRPPRARAGWPGSRCSTGSAAAPASCPRSASCRRRCRGWTSTACWPAPPPATRPPAATTCRRNPAALMALMWHHATGGKGKKDMVVLPYKDRLLLFSRYLQQLVMESLGKQLDLQGQARRAGPRGLRQQGLDRPARLRPAAARGRAELLRRVHPGAGGRRLGARGRAGGRRPATTCTASCSAPARPCSRTAGSR